MELLSEPDSIQNGLPASYASPSY